VQLIILRGDHYCRSFPGEGNEITVRDRVFLPICHRNDEWEVCLNHALKILLRHERILTQRPGRFQPTWVVSGVEGEKPFRREGRSLLRSDHAP